MAETIEEMRVRLTADAKNFIDALDQSGQRVEVLRELIKKLAAETDATYRQIAQTLTAAEAKRQQALVNDPKNMDALTGKPKTDVVKQSSQDMKQYTQDVNNAVAAQRALDAEASKANKTLKDQGSSALSVGNAFKSLSRAFDVTFGLGFYAIISKIIGGFQQMITESIEFAKELYKLGASVRALQAQGLDVTIKGTLQEVMALRKEFGIFSTRELVGGIAQIQMLTRNFGFTNAEMMNMVKVTSALSVVLGKDFKNTAASLALFLSSGYGEALQRAGIAVNRLAVAQEAARMGYSRNYMALTEIQRAHAGYNLIMSQSKDIVNELTNYQKEYVGQLQATQAQTEDLKNATELALAPLYKAFAQIKLTGMTFLVDALNFLIATEARAIEYFIIIAATAVRAFEEVKIAYQNLQNFMAGKPPVAPTIGWVEMVKKIHEDTNKAIKEAQIERPDINTLLPFMGPGGTTVPKEATVSDEDLDKYGKIAKDLYDELLVIQKKYQDDSDKLYTDWQTDVLELHQKADEDVLKAEEDFQSKLADLAKDRDKAIAEAYKKAADATAELNRQTADKIAAANKKFHDSEIKSERDYQERMKRLREDFLLALEDALRERDALQVLRLIRKYNLDKERAAEEQQDQLDDLRKQHADELAEIQKSDAEKRAEIQKSLQEQLADAQANYDEKSAEAQAAHDKELQQINDNAVKEEAALQEKYDKQKQQLSDSLTEQVDEATVKWAEMNNLTTEQANMISGIIDKVFGKDGSIATVWDIYLANYDRIVNDLALKKQKLDEAVNAALLAKAEVDAALLATQQSLDKLPPGTSGGGNFPPYAPQYYPPYQSSGAPFRAAGGVGIATSPSYAVYGEAGPELALFTPLNRLGDIPKQLSSVGIDLAGGSGGSASIRIYLSSGLEAEIVDKALGTVAEIVKGSR